MIVVVSPSIQQLPVKFFAFVVSAIMLVGCGEPTIDGSSQEALKESTAEIRSTLTEEEIEQFNDALALVGLQGLDFSSIFSGNFDSEQSTGQAIEDLDGMTYEDVMSRADEIRQEREERMREQALTEIEELQEKKRAAEMAEKDLQDIVVTRSRYYIEERDFGFTQPVIDISISNNTEHAISRAYFDGTVASPERSVPWIEEQFNFSISGGLEPGEEDTFKLSPNRYSDWGTTDVPGDAIFTAEPYRVDGPDGESLFPETDFSNSDERRLNELLSTYGVSN